MPQFTSAVLDIHGWPVIHLPNDISGQLPSRGLVMASGTVNGYQTDLPLEPDGNGGHWFKTMLAVGTVADVRLAVVFDWPEPAVPPDVQQALDSQAEISKTWYDITPAARWDWLRWINATANPATRAKRITVALDKMRKGSRRPCCFNRSMCTEPAVSKNGRLQIPAAI